MSAAAAFSSSQRVLHVIASVSPKRGGTSTAIWNTLEALRRTGTPADLVTTDDDGPLTRAGVPLDCFVEHQGHRVRYFPRQSDFYAASLPLAAWLARHVTDYDVVHIHGLFTFSSVAAARIARAKRVPYIICPHGMLERWCREHRRPLLKRSSIAVLEGPILKHAARVHFTSESECEQAAALGIPMKSAVIPLGVSIDAPVVATTGAAPTILFLSRIDGKKGLDLLVDAYARVAARRTDVRLAIAGDGDAELQRALVQRIERFGLTDRVQWLGFVAGDVKARTLGGATLFVLPSSSENFGYAVVEAMLAGIPVIVTDAVGVSSIVARARAGLVVEQTTESLANAIDQLLADASLRAAMGRAGREIVSADLSLESFGRRLRSLYDSL